MGNTALITGASSGIGTELARYHASKGGDVVLVARRENKLNDLKAELERTCGITATVIAADLAESDAAENWIIPFLPRKLVLKISRKAMEKK
ncbi:SDR family NAD(P)-dependent oxidoreductase [Desulfoluna spongiiphila]|uniref:Short chain dehydrogenase n=1 Tax=Desulfoluna spongiiphila TaxID=419481 RepID=A0A1G5FLJ3_9BACT|nr:SDR family NAD(P)-dependent oxidoreductase [Desulfoluna spongiiphila]SCY40139.1 hypothetical protein SAMN05216233_108143 [Desulfoluna spongiiphila]